MIDMSGRAIREQAIRDFHSRVCDVKFRGWLCDCDLQFTRMEVFKEVHDKWLS